jgi:CBS domain-containing protein
MDINVNISKLEKFMTKEVFVVNENDLVDLVAKIMEWKNIHHIPVVNNNNKVIGIITNTNIEKTCTNKDKLLIARDIMVENIITVNSDTSIEDANNIMIKNKIGCLPILELGELIGILTKKDLEKLLVISKEND